jgi:hypothetical protein
MDMGLEKRHSATFRRLYRRVEYIQPRTAGRGDPSGLVLSAARSFDRNGDQY